MRRATVFTVIVLVLGASLAFATATAVAETHVIYPTGNFPDDVNNVQQVLDDLGSRGVNGKVILKATNEEGDPTSFNFGTGDVMLPPEAGGTRWGVEVLGDEYNQSGDIQIQGEVARSRQTTIHGGYLSIWVVRRARLRISNIFFDGAMLAPVTVLRSSGAWITDNTITNVIEEPWGIGQYGAQKGLGIWVLSASTSDDIVGRVIIRNNHIDGVFADSGDGIAVLGVDARVEITHNTILNVNRIGILVPYNKKRILIAHNFIAPGPGTVGGIFANESFGISFHSPQGPGPSILGNEIIGDHPLFLAIQLAAFRFPDTPPEILPLYGALVANNDIQIIQGELGLLLQSEGEAVHHNTIVGNRIAGNVSDGFSYGVGIHAASAYGLEGSEISDNFLASNDLEDLQVPAGNPHVILGESTRNNRYVGKCETVWDHGIDNVVRLSCPRGGR
jgi:hypothetical protein